MPLNFNFHVCFIDISKYNSNIRARIWKVETHVFCWYSVCLLFSFFLFFFKLIYYVSCNAVVPAVRAFGTKEEVLRHLLAQIAPDPSEAAKGSTSTSVSEPSYANPSTLIPNEDMVGEGPSTVSEVKRDVEMEDELAEELRKGDAYSDYDIEVTKEGEAINEYLALLISGANN